LSILFQFARHTAPPVHNIYWTFRRQIQLMSVKLSTGQLADYSTRRQQTFENHG